jgi:hypothetical protein
MFKEITLDTYSVVCTAHQDALGKRKNSCPLADSIFLFSCAYAIHNFTGVMVVAQKNFGTFPVK